MVIILYPKRQKVIDVVNVTEVSSETGEVIRYTKEVFQPKDIDEIANRKKCDEFSVLIDTEFGAYFFNFYEKINSIDIENRYKMRFIYLCCYCDWTDRNNILVNTSKTTYRNKLNKDGLREILLLQDREFRNTLYILQNNKLLIPNDDGTYSVSEEYAIKGKINANDSKNEHYTRVFSKTIKELYLNSKTKSHSQLYLFFILLPYINKRYNIVCSNPNEKYVDEVKALTMKDICNILGYEQTQHGRLWNTLKTFMVGNKYVIGRFERGDGNFIKINPSVYYANTYNNPDDLDIIKALMMDFEYRI